MMQVSLPDWALDNQRVLTDAQLAAAAREALAGSDRKVPRITADDNADQAAVHAVRAALDAFNALARVAADRGLRVELLHDTARPDEMTGRTPFYPVRALITRSRGL